MRRLELYVSWAMFLAPVIVFSAVAQIALHHLACSLHKGLRRYRAQFGSSRGT